MLNWVSLSLFLPGFQVWHFQKCQGLLPEGAGAPARITEAGTAELRVEGETKPLHGSHVLKQLQRSHLWSVEDMEGGEGGDFRGVGEVMKTVPFR